MELNEAIKEAKQQMNQAIYLCESTPGVYNTGLQSVYEKKSAMLCCLIYEIERCHAELDMLKKTSKTGGDRMREINDPLELLKAQQALRSENMKFEYRMKNKPEEINILDYTVVAALEKQIPRKCEGLKLESGRIDDGFDCCPNCNRILIEDYCFCPDCGQKIDWEEK